MLIDIANGSATASPLAYTNDDGGRSGTTGEGSALAEPEDETPPIYSPKGENSPNLIQATTYPNGDPIENPPPESAALIAKNRAKLARVNFDKGMQYRDSGDSSRALIEFLKATREDPKLIDAYYEQALIFREKGFTKLAVSRLEQALAIRPKYSRARLLLATLKLEQGKVSDAVEQLGESLNLQKTAIKPDEEPNSDNKFEGVPPMILQSLHVALPLPVVPKTERELEVAEASNEESKPEQLRETPKAKAPASRSVRKKRPANRRKIRELIARKYKANDKTSEQRHNWIAKLFSWPETFKAGNPEDNRVAYADDDVDDLEPKPASNLKKEFNGRSTEDDEPILPQAKKTLLAYNGNPAHTLDLLNAKAGKKQVLDDSDTVDKPFGWGSESRTDRAALNASNESRYGRDYYENAHAHAIKGNSERSSHEMSSKNERVHEPSTKLEDTHAPRVEHAVSSAREADFSSKTTASIRSNPSQKAPSKGASLVHKGDDEGTPFYLNAHKADSRLLASKPTAAGHQAPAVKLPPLTKRDPAYVEDEWTKRLRYLAENGTSSLKHGEAFMFSEDTGEAVLFLAGGQRIRRMITAPVDSQEVIKMRRPDVLIPKELFFNTSLLGKVVKDPPAPPPVSQNPIPPPRGMDSEMDQEMEQLLKHQSPSSSSKTSPPPNFKIEQIMDNPTGFWNWSKRLLNL